jgi:hypothetical protein
MSDPLYLDVTTEHSGVTRIGRNDAEWAEWLARYHAGDEAVSAGGIIQPPADIVPATISDRQMAQIMAAEGIITEAEALAWVSAGTVPAAMDALVDVLPEADRFAARMLLAGATVFERSHPLVAVLGESYGMTSTAIDDLFRAAALL